MDTANIDTDKPVIVECLGMGGNGINGSQVESVDLGGEGGAGGGYASKDISQVSSATFLIGIDADSSTLLDEFFNVVTSAQGGGLNSPAGGYGSGDVVFYGGDAAAGDTTSGGAGGKAAKPYADGEDYTGPLGATIDDNAASGTEPGEGGGGGFGAGAKTAGGTGLEGYVKIHYSLVIPVTPVEVVVPAEGSRKSIRIDSVNNVVSGSPVVSEGGSIKRLGDGGGVSTAGPKHGCQEFIVTPGENLT